MQIEDVHVSDPVHMTLSLHTHTYTQGRKGLAGGNDESQGLAGGNDGSQGFSRRE